MLWTTIWIKLNHCHSYSCRNMNSPKKFILLVDQFCYSLCIKLNFLERSVIWDREGGKSMISVLKTATTNMYEDSLHRDY